METVFDIKWRMRIPLKYSPRILFGEEIDICDSSTVFHQKHTFDSVPEDFCNIGKVMKFRQLSIILEEGV